MPPTKSVELLIDEVIENNIRFAIEEKHMYSLVQDDLPLVEEEE